MERSAEHVEVRLFYQTLMVPFAIEADKDGGHSVPTGRERASAIAKKLIAPWREITAERWRHLPSDEQATGDDLARAYGEFVYFEPSVQRYLFDFRGEPEATTPIRLWRRTDVQALDVAIDVDGVTEHWRLRVRRLNFYLFDSGNAMLVVELAFDPALAAGLADSDAGLPKLAKVMRFMERIRRVFPPFFYELKGELIAGLFPTHLEWSADPPIEVRERPSTARDYLDEIDAKLVSPLHPAWQALLSALPLEGNAAPKASGFQLSQLGDDRAFSIVVMGVDDSGVIAEPDWVRLAMCDGPGTGWPYGRAFLQGWHEHQAYDRHFHGDQGGTRYLFSGYSFAMIGTARRPDDGEHCEFRDTFAEHGRRHYFQLCLIAYFQKNALLTLSERLAETILAVGTSTAAAHAMEREILQFTHRYWFETLSAQVQAQEIFELLRTNLRLRSLYQQVRQEVREADALATNDEQQGIARSAQSLNVIAAFGLAASVIVGFFGMNVFAEDHFMTASRDFVWAMALAMTGGFATLFLFRDQLISLFTRGRPARTVLPLLSVLLLLAGLALLLRLQNSP